MRLFVESYDGHDLNDASLSGYIPMADRNLQNLATVQSIEIERGGNFPSFGGKVLAGKNFILQVDIKGNYATYLDTLKGWFDTRTPTLKKLLMTDSDTSVQWSLMCTCVDMPMRNTTTCQFLMYAPDPVMKAETGVTASWAITATGQQKTVTPAGNVPTQPKITLMPTTAKVGGYGFKKFMQLVNQHTINAFRDYPFDIVEHALDTASLVKVASQKVQINKVGGVAIGDTTIPYNSESGTFPTSGIAYIDGATKEQISYTGKTATDLTGVTRGINGTSAAAHADDVWIYSSLIQADGDDIRVVVDGVEAPRWLSGMNTAATKVWTNINLNPLKTATIKTAIANTGAVGTIDLYLGSRADISIAIVFLAGIRSTGGIVKIDNELFTYTGIDQAKRTLTGVIRASKGTSMAAHTTQTTITFIEHDIWLMYGNPSAGAPDQDETKKPIIDLAASTNDSWVYADFWDTGGIRAGCWKPAVVKTLGRWSGCYGGISATYTDLATVLGMHIAAYEAGGKWKAETATLEWSLYHPAGITQVSSDGSYYRSNLNWPLTASSLLRGNSNGSNWVAQWTIASPISMKSWPAWTKNGEALGATYNNIKFSFSGSTGANAYEEANFEVANVTLTLDSTKRPAVTALAEQPNYWMDCKITNTTTGEWLSIAYLMNLNSVITIDCENKTAYYDDNSVILGALQFSTPRLDWLNLSPGANVLQYDDVGTVAVTSVVTFNSRNN
jgi:hypothetical protein